MFANDRTFNVKSYAQKIQSLESYKRRHPPPEPPPTSARPPSGEIPTIIDPDGCEDAGNAAPTQNVALTRPNTSARRQGTLTHNAQTLTDQSCVTKQRPRPSEVDASRREDHNGAPRHLPTQPAIDDHPWPRRYGSSAFTSTAESPGATTLSPARPSARVVDSTPAVSNAKTSAATVRTTNGPTALSSASATSSREFSATRDPVPTMVEKEAETVQAPSEGRSTSCGLCLKDLKGGTKYPCQDCSILICPSCIINAAILHPGHTIRSATTDGTRRGPTHLHGPESATHTCRVCQRLIKDVRYECQRCTNATKVVNICGACRGLSLHPAGHQLKAINCDPSCPPRPLAGSTHDADNSGGPDEVAEAHNSDVDGSEELEVSDDVGEVDNLHSLGGGPSERPRRRPEKMPSRASTSEDAGTIPSGAGALAGPADNETAIQRRPSQVTITFSRHALRQYVRMAKAMIAAGEQMLGKAGPWLDEMGDVDLDCGEADDDSDGADYDPHRLLDFIPDLDPEPKRRRTQVRRWLPEDKQRLSTLKRQGWDDARIAIDLGRSAGAIAQQWRKQADDASLDGG